ncbi:hypothetical protein P7K49_003145 [Saguinus oedipus]|uniref:Basic proline-rich protein-like n=1 Tax=Saguinus oedipus TaxID=9490 RepID=A0ABQ9WJC1_SAGOE|nr:hypothetical protein P7K49_003145 [Saguinus oedipus]
MSPSSTNLPSSNRALTGFPDSGGGGSGWERRDGRRLKKHPLVALSQPQHSSPRNVVPWRLCERGVLPGGAAEGAHLRTAAVGSPGSGLIAAPKGAVGLPRAGRAPSGDLQGARRGAGSRPGLSPPGPFPHSAFPPALPAPAAGPHAAASFPELRGPGGVSRPPPVPTAGRCATRVARSAAPSPPVPTAAPTARQGAAVSAPEPQSASEPAARTSCLRSPGRSPGRLRLRRPCPAPAAPRRPRPRRSLTGWEQTSAGWSRSRREAPLGASTPRNSRSSPRGGPGTAGGGLRAAPMARWRRGGLGPAKGAASYRSGAFPSAVKLESAPPSSLPASSPGPGASRARGGEGLRLGWGVA